MIAALGIGLGLVTLTYGLSAIMTQSESISPLATTLLLALIWLAPIKALDNLHESLASVFGGARLVFVKRALLVPFLRLSAVLYVIWTSGNVLSLAISHVVVGTAGTLLYAALVWRLLQQREVLKGLSLSSLASNLNDS